MKEDQMMKNTMKKIPRRRTRLMKKTFVCSVVLLVSLMALGASGAWAVVDIPLVNHSFETGDLTGWVPQYGFMDVRGASVPGMDGSYALCMGQPNGPHINKFVGPSYTVQANTVYTVSAMVGAHPGCTGENGYFRFIFINNPDNYDGGYKEGGYSPYFSCPDSTMQLYSFSVDSTTHPEWTGMYIAFQLGMGATTWSSYQLWDNVHLTATTVPEPGSLAALGTGLMGLVGFIARRRRA